MKKLFGMFCKHLSCHKEKRTSCTFSFTRIRTPPFLRLVFLKTYNNHAHEVCSSTVRLKTHITHQDGSTNLSTMKDIL
jgi:hypothetical protein